MAGTVVSVSATLTKLAERLQELRPSRSAYPPWPSDAVLAGIIGKHGEVGMRHIGELFAAREKIIREAKENPFDKGFEWACWLRADDCLPLLPWEKDPRKGYIEPLTPYRLIVPLGGNRASKSEYAVKRCMQSLVRFPNTRMIFLAQKLETSRQIQQEYCWRYMPPALRALNDKPGRKKESYIHYQKGVGFSAGTNSAPKFVLPNGSEGVFLVYTQAASDYEGIQIGCPDQPGVIGWYADESLPLDWLKLLRVRSATYDAVGLWTFTPLNGMTQALKEVVGKGKVLDSAIEPFLADRQNLPNLPKGHMPLLAEGAKPDIRIVYFHSRENPLGGYERVRDNLRGKPWYMAERGLCGYTKDTRGRRFASFGAWNIVAPEAVPREGTVYMHVDPHAARNWFLLWVLVDPEGRKWVIDEWPPEEQYGEWAVTTERNPTEDSGAGWDGDAGPAQEPCGYGITQYKQEILMREKAAGIVDVERRTVDRRAAPAPKTELSGPSTCLWQELNDEQLDPKTGDQLAPALDFDLAGGAAIEEDGIAMIDQALFVDMDRPIDPMKNYPALFVSNRCKQLIWALENFTGKDKQRGACKDPIDCLRDMFTSGLEHYAKGTLGTFGGGSY
jgi:hypothetical protein